MKEHFLFSRKDTVKRALHIVSFFVFIFGICFVLVVWTFGKGKHVGIHCQRKFILDMGCVIYSSNVNDDQVKPRSLRFTWSMKTTSSRDPNEIMMEIRKVFTLPHIKQNHATKQ